MGDTVSAPVANTDRSRWPFALRPLNANLGAEIVGVDLGGSVSDDLFACMYGAFLAHQLLLFRDQRLAPGAQVDFARRFGDVQIHPMNQYHANGYPELYSLSNLDAEGQPSGAHPDRGTLAWHTDGSWRRRTGHATIMYAEIVPTRGGETHFCNMYAAWDALTPARKAELSDLRAVHSLDFSRTRRHGEDPMTQAQRTQVPPVDHPIVRTHPETERRCIYLGDHAEFVAGLAYDIGRALIETINAQAIHPSRVYAHRWRPGDLLVWDNRCLLHRATEYDTAREPRVMRRCTILGDVPR